MKSLLLLISICFTSTTVLNKISFAGSNVQFFNGAKLLTLCKDTNANNQSACEGYILGIQDAINSGHLSQFFNLCIPDGITPKDLRLQIINFIRINPQTINFGGESVVAKSLELNFKCKK
tara:strand:- start:81 stop:440 length:360 start_codon:yes stop_codon:yes gene_type:complete